MIDMKQYSIKARLQGGLGIIIAFMVVLTVIGTLSLQNINSKLEDIISINNAKILLAQTVQTSVNEIDKHFLTLNLVADETTTAERKQAIESAAATYLSSMEKFKKLETTAKGKELIADIESNYSIAQTNRERVLEFFGKGDVSQAKNAAIGALSVSDLLSKGCAEIVKYQEKQSEMEAKSARSTFMRSLYLLLGIGTLTCIFAVMLSLQLTKSITKPLSEGVVVAEKITQGDLTATIGTISSDETGQLMNALRDMVMKLRGIITEVKTAAYNIASASHQLNASSELMSKGADEQAGRAAQVATASEEMSQTVLDIAKNTSNIELSATETTKLAKDGETVVNRSVEKVKLIANTISESAQFIQSLGDRSNQIGEIINVINDIADQTNLLALNAAIEAARAGEQGRGFAVVADEVRKLAERTGNSTAEIGDMVKSIQNEVHEVVISMDNITKEVKAGVELSTEAGNVLRNIVEGVDRLHLMVQQIASATEEMASTSEEINKDISMISSLSKETSGSSGQIAHASGDLSKLSISLEEVVKGFNV